jgi:FkbM family methyltransferase
MITPGSLVVDIGANNGWYTLVAAARVGRDGRVLAFEPDPRSSDSIRSLIAANQLESRVNLHAEAVGAERRLQMLHLTPDPAKSYRELGEVDPRAEGVEVDVYPASDLWREPGFSTGAVMKVDTEGAEQLVLNALLEAAPLAAKLPIIMFEFVPSQYDRAGASATSLVQDLLNRGYCLYRIDYTAGGLTPWGAHAGTATARNLVAIPSALEVEVLARVHGGFAPSEVSRE